MSLGRRALLALLLTVAFYVLALVLAAGLVAIPVAEWVLLHRVTPLIALGAAITAAVIVWSILPRRLPPPPPGLRLDPAANGRLFAELRDVAELVREPMPVEVSLDLTVGAGVAQRGGVLGIGGRRVMVLGLPLLQVLRITELKAVIAHEFGHYLRGDTRLAPWVYRTNVTILSTRERVARYSDLVHWPFSLYAGLFQRVTMSISRRQEVLADELAARTWDGAAVEPHEELEKLASGRLSPTSWRQRCGQLRIEGLSL
jgi:heat shock protein HtpX